MQIVPTYFSRIPLRGCPRKIRFGSAKEALKHTHRKQNSQRVYRCDICGAYHLTKMTGKVYTNTRPDTPPFNFETLKDYIQACILIGNRIPYPESIADFFDIDIHTVNRFINKEKDYFENIELTPKHMKSLAKGRTQPIILLTKGFEKISSLLTQSIKADESTAPFVVFYKMTNGDEYSEKYDTETIAKNVFLKFCETIERDKRSGYIGITNNQINKLIIKKLYERGKCMKTVGGFFAPPTPPLKFIKPTYALPQYQIKNKPDKLPNKIIQDDTPIDNSGLGLYDPTNPTRILYNANNAIIDTLLTNISK